MKRRDLERHLRAYGCRAIDEGANQTRWRGFDGMRATVPRHREIAHVLAREICRRLDVPPPRAGRGSSTSFRRLRC
jgi:hypothetical protein